MAQSGIKYLAINSKDRLAHSTSSTDCIFQVDASLATSADVVSFQMPMTSYNINSMNNVVYFNDGGDKTFSVDPGNYSAYDYIIALEAGFNSVSSDFTVTYSDISMRLTISALTPFSLTFGTNITNSSAYIMGFNYVDTGSSTIQRSHNAIDLSLPLFLYCRIDEFATNVKSTDRVTNATFCFSNKVNGTDLLSYSENTDWKQCSFIREVNIQALHVRFVFHNNVQCDIQNNDWTMLLRLHYC